MVSPHHHPLLPCHLDDIRSAASPRPKRPSTASTLALPSCARSQQMHSTRSAPVSRSHSPAPKLSPSLPEDSPCSHELVASRSTDSAQQQTTPTAHRTLHSRQRSPTAPPLSSASAGVHSESQHSQVTLVPQQRKRARSEFNSLPSVSIKYNTSDSQSPHHRSSSSSAPPAIGTSPAKQRDRKGPPTPPPSHRVVFVNPDDESQPWWWPALVVPEEDFEMFKALVDNDVERPGLGELLVCYFEDASFNVVRESDAAPFNPNAHPYTTYLNGPQGERFKKDKAVHMATTCLQNGIVPRTFGWLHKSSPPPPKVKMVTFSDVKEEHPPPPPSTFGEDSTPPSPSSREPPPKKLKTDPRPSLKRVGVLRGGVKKGESNFIVSQASPPVPSVPESALATESFGSSGRSPRSPDDDPAYAACKKRRWLRIFEASKQPRTVETPAPPQPAEAEQQRKAGALPVSSSVIASPVVEDEIEEGEVVEDLFLREDAKTVQKVVHVPITPPPS
ncbi:hypothetical protein BJ742DRAFT_202031 [Cladochytrium replicatum]|nr:hypothetical protein BJ742DRAFT_202031 [Cladochytrium replicatum]